MWTLGGIRIFVQRISDTVKQIIAQLNPLAGGSVYQVFGYETDKYKVVAKVVGSGDLSMLRSLTTSGIYTFELISPAGSLGNFLVSTVNVDRENCIYQTIRRDLDCESPVYNVEIELFEED